MQTFDLNLLRVFVALFQERNVTKAAQQLGQTQSTTSSALARLRIVFKDKLFVRTAHGLAATARAEDLAGPIINALQQIGQAASLNQEFDPQSSDYHFRVHAPEHVISLLLPRLLPLLNSEAPQVTLDLQSTYGNDGPEHLRSGRLDFLISYAFEPPPDNFRVMRLFRESSVVIASRRHRTPSATLTLEDYVAAKHVVLRPFQTWRYSPIDHALQKLGHSRKVAISVASHLMAVNIVRNSDLISSVPKSVAQAFTDPEEIITYPSPFLVTPFDVSVVWHEREQSNAAHQWFRTLLKRCRGLD
ncbi:LysR family transcriptional regulator [Beijerinckia sp. 28-YEA-48]|uniref:LysR family transcriptional regulator n=2 Tax=unclassified Beijerinckia TaxID=2638183 RepID=UPI000898C645|nr:LysR family transcriptional regulator [Beijerinckia sp. 28-YEA-48]SED93854.1 transcriptional regulator, LysR family [Beijerinckia sp. 28-YEA-48]